MSPTPPGLLRSDIAPEVVMMICTAGHVDHGKTSLVKALTGCMTDRLKEEIERGLTIELGFAPCWIGGRQCVGIVDVPGHERFVRTMVAGVSGIDLCILVIAADDGIMPQTLEHVEIMQLLGVRAGVVALTKTDLVSPETVASRRAEIETLLRPTFLNGAPIFPLSTVTFEGYAEFHEALTARIAAAPRRRPSGVFRLPVERAFSRPGFGAVVSGIPLSGRVRAGEEIECVPGGLRGRVRGLQCFLRPAEEGGAGQCLALNIPEFGKRPPDRGDVLAPPGFLQAGCQFHLDLRATPRLDPPLRNAEPVTLHTGTAERAGHVFLLEAKTLGGGGSMLATVVVDQPMAAAPGDRCIVRRRSPPATVAGGELLRVEAAPRRARRRLALESLQQQKTFFGGVDLESDAGRRRRVEFALGQTPAVAMSVDALARAVILPPGEVATAVRDLAAGGIAIEFGDGLFALKERMAALEADVARRLGGMAAESGKLRAPMSDLRRGWTVPNAVWERCCADLAATGRLRVVGEVVLLAASMEDLPDGERALAERMMALFEKEGYETTHPDEVHAKLNATPAQARRMLDYLCGRGDLVRVAPNVVLTRSRLRAAQEYVIETIRANGALASPAFRDYLGVSRKYAMAILDFMDVRRITLRVQNDRRLLPGWEQRRL